MGDRMDMLQMTGRKRETYSINLQYSLLWESALGIAAVTNDPIIDTLKKDWMGLKQTLSPQLIEQLGIVQKNNTWKCLLQLLHSTNVKQIGQFTSYMKQLDKEAFTFICLPFIGDLFQNVRKKAAQGDEEAILTLQHETRDNVFFPAYIQYVVSTEAELLKEHLIHVIELWYKEVVLPERDQLEQILANDYEEKRNMAEKTSPEQFVEWATGGNSYPPEPSVQTVLLIPQYAYRPWTIEADVEGTKVFYYPISNTSIAPEDRYMPHDFLVERYKALGDETRLRIVKILSEKSSPLQEVTDQLQMGKSTIHHHLKLLRAAKLVVIQDGKYVLRKESVERLATELELYMNK